MENIQQISFGDHIRALREGKSMPLRRVAAVLDIDPSTLSKVERGDRLASREMLPILAKLFEISENDLTIIFFSDRVASQLRYEENTDVILKVAESRIKYLREKDHH